MQSLQSLLKDFRRSKTSLGVFVLVSKPDYHTVRMLVDLAIILTWLVRFCWSSWFMLTTSIQISCEASVWLLIATRRKSCKFLVTGILWWLQHIICVVVLDTPSSFCSTVDRPHVYERALWRGLLSRFITLRSTMMSFSSCAKTITSLMSVSDSRWSEE